MKKIAIDTETSWKNCRNIPFIATICEENLNTQLFDLRTPKGIRNMKEIAAEKAVKVFHNAPFDITACRNIDIQIVGPYEDTMLQANIINENFESKRLKPLAKLYLNEPCNEEKELKKVKRQLEAKAKKEGKIFTWDMIPAETLYPYAKKDPWYTMRLNQLFSKTIGKYADVYRLECSLIPIIAEMQFLGMRIDRKFVLDHYKKYIEEMKKLMIGMNKTIEKKGVRFSEEKIYKRYPKKSDLWDSITGEEGKYSAVRYIPFNPNADAQVRKILLALDIHPTMYTEKKHEVSINKEALAPFKQVPFIDNFLRHKFLSKQTGTYYGPMYTWYTDKKNDRAHFSLFQSGAKSGRFTAELIQTIPRKDEDKPEEQIRLIRNAFIPGKGYSFACIDYDQVEMRLFASFSKCKPLIDHFLAGRDPYLGAAVDIWGKKILGMKKEVTKGYRRKAKTISLGIIYGMGDNKLSASLGVPTIEAHDILQRYFAKYPVRNYMREVISNLYRQGSVSVVLDSPLMKLFREYRVPHDLAYKAVNIIIQGVASYVMKMGMKRCWDYIKKKELDIRMLTTIHDELIFEINQKYDVIKMANILKELMEDKITFKVPILASIKLSNKSWGETKEIKGVV